VENSLNPAKVQLFFLRHAAAEERDSARCSDDSERPLTKQGVRKMEHIARGMKHLGLSFDVIISSPFLRARQTAEITAAVIAHRNAIYFTDHLAPDGKARILLRELSSNDFTGKSLLFVGHEPYLTGLITLLCTGDWRTSLQLKKGGLCHLTATKLLFGPCADFEWLLTPNLLLRF
jgi:phosphohistidine phosphatase